MTPDELRSRWNEAETQTVLDILTAKTPKYVFTPVRLDDCPGLGLLPDGRWDLRGLRVPHGLSKKALAGVSFDHGDWGRGGGGGLSVQASNCSFEALELNSVWGRYENCNFRRIRMSRGWFGEVEFIDCDFSRANLSHVGGGGRFTRCRFDGANFRGAHTGGIFDSCTLTGARFGFGSLGRSRFIDTSLDDVDLKDTIMKGVTFE